MDRRYKHECTAAGFRRWQAADWAAYGKPGAQSRVAQDRLMAGHDAAQDAWFTGFLSKLFGTP